MHIYFSDARFLRKMARANSPEIKYAARLNTPPEVNNFLAILDSCFLQATALALPSLYSISVSVVCNLHCPYCARQTFSELVEDGLMEIEKFATLEKYLKFSRITSLYGLGEPFLHPIFFEFVRLAKKGGSYISTSTHGMTLTPEVIRNILDSKLDELEVSIDAVDPKLFSYLRRGAELQTIIKNVRHLQAEKKQRGTSLPKLQIASAISVYNLREIPKLVKLANQLQADSIVFSNLIVSYPEDRYSSVCPSATFESAIKEAKKMGNRLGIVVHYFYQKPHPWQREIFWRIDTASPEAEPVWGYGCPLAYHHFFVDLKGNVTPCCYFPEHFGNCFDEPPEQIHNNARFRQLRQALITGKLPVCCSDCGNLVRTTPTYLAGKIAEAEKNLEKLANAVSETEHTKLRNLLAEFKQKTQEIIESFQSSSMEKRR